MSDQPEPPGMIGEPPSARYPAIPADPAEHAVRFAREWQQVAETYVQSRMKELGIPENRVGAIEYAQGGVRRAFDPKGRAGGTCDEHGRLYVDSGVLNPALLSYLPGVADEAWKKSRLRHRIDAIISHEDEETHGSHKSAVERASETTLPIAGESRYLLRLIEEAENQQRGR